MNRRELLVTAGTVIGATVSSATLANQKKPTPPSQSGQDHRDYIMVGIEPTDITDDVYKAIFKTDRSKPPTDILAMLTDYSSKVTTSTTDVGGNISYLVASVSAGKQTLTVYQDFMQFTPYNLPVNGDSTKTIRVRVGVGIRIQSNLNYWLGSSKYRFFDWNRGSGSQQQRSRHIASKCIWYRRSGY